MSDAADTHRDLLALCSLTDGGDRCDWGVIARQAHRERTLDALKEGKVIESSERAHRTYWLITTASPVQWARAYDRADAELEAAAAQGARMTTVLDDDYPTNLRFIHNLPPFLFYRGVLDPHLDARSIAVVGTRKATDEGLKRARAMARKLAESLATSQEWAKTMLQRGRAIPVGNFDDLARNLVDADRLLAASKELHLEPFAL